MRFNGEFVVGLDNGAGHGIVTATCAQGGHGTFVVLYRQPNGVGIEAWVVNAGFLNKTHAAFPCFMSCAMTSMISTDDRGSPP